MLRTTLISALLALATLVAVPSAHALQLGFDDEDLLHMATSDGRGADDAGMAAGLTAARDAGASDIRVSVRWSDIAPTQPPTDAQADDPSWPGYDWSVLDREVRAVSAAGLKPLLWASRAPTWAEGAGRPPISAYVPAGSWKPNANAFGEFAKALAKRYSGSFPDPLNAGTVLPRVTQFQGWNEPNIYPELMPQYVKSGSGYVNASVDMFRSLQNAFYLGVKSVAPSATVLAASTAPFGDYPDGGNRTPPVEFWRELLCETVSGKSVAVDPKCPKIYFDAWAHNPYSPYVPTKKALNADDVTVPDLGKLVPLVKQGVAAGVVKPRSNKPLWITELSWDSTPDPSGLSSQAQANNMQGAISVLARAGAQHILFWNSRDDAPVPSYDQSYQSGIFYRGATPAQDTRKVSWTAYRFPLSAYRSGGKVNLWGKAPAAGRVVIERRIGAGGTWKKFAVLKAGADGVFSKRVVAPAGAQFHAVQGALTSLVGTG